MCVGLKLLLLFICQSERVYLPHLSKSIAIYYILLPINSAYSAFLQASILHLVSDLVNH